MTKRIKAHVDAALATEAAIAEASRADEANVWRVGHKDNEIHLGIGFANGQTEHIRIPRGAWPVNRDELIHGIENGIKDNRITLLIEYEGHVLFFGTDILWFCEMRVSD